MGNCMYNKELPTISNMAPLTPEQISLIKATWAIPAQNPIDSGEAVLYAFFEKYPSNQQKFLAFKNVPLPELKGTNGFRTHAGRVVTVINAAIEALDNENYVQELETIWNKIGETHEKRKISQQAFNELGDVLLDVLTAVCKLDDTGKTAWGALFEAIFDILFKNIHTLTHD